MLIALTLKIGRQGEEGDKKVEDLALDWWTAMIQPQKWIDSKTGYVILKNVNVIPKSTRNKQLLMEKTKYIIYEAYKRSSLILPVDLSVAGYGNMLKAEEIGK
jgi:hypothetical protein